MNKFEQVSSDRHQMSLAVGLGPGGPRGTGEAGAGRLYSEVQCIMGNGYMGTLPSVDRQTHTSENITFPQLRWRALIFLKVLEYDKYNRTTHAWVARTYL